MKLQDPCLRKTEAYVGGRWIGGGTTFAVKNPADGSTVAEVPRLGAGETRGAIEAAAEAFPAWRDRTAADRSALLRRWYELILANQEDLAVLMTSEQGKPLAESRGEIAYAASFIEWFAEEGKRVYGDVIPEVKPGTRIVVTRQAIGVTAAITPWNFPAAMITRKVGPALAAGCTSVVKPAEATPLSALALAELAERAGIPPGVLNVVTGPGKTIGAELTSNPLVRKLSFTGSTEVGRDLMEQSSPTLKRLSLELGGNAPFLVFDDADLEAAIEGAIASKYRNTGQTCVCANRFLVQAGIFDRFAAALVERVGAFVVGDGMDAGVTQGPLINAEAVEKVESLLADARKKGARVLVGGARHALGGNFFEPTVLADVTGAMELTREEIFGPVAPLQRFETEEEGIRLANDTIYGLAAYAYTRNLGRAWRLTRALEYGIIGLNEGIISTAVAPFGGVKQSGLGREGSRYGIDEYLDVKYSLMGGI